MKKKILLIFSVFLLTGCSGNYEIEIYNDQVTEKTTPWYQKSEVSKDVYEYTQELSLKYDDNGDFLRCNEKKEVAKDEQIGIELKNHYSSISDYQENSPVLDYCYIAHNVTSYENDLITLKTSKEFTCMKDIEELEKVTIAIESNHKLKETNADKVKNNTYYWYIDKDNYENKPISLVLYENKYVWNYKNKNIKRLFLILIVIGGTVLLSSSIYKIYLKEKDRM